MVRERASMTASIEGISRVAAMCRCRDTTVNIATTIFIVAVHSSGDFQARPRRRLPIYPAS